MVSLGIVCVCGCAGGCVCVLLALCTSCFIVVFMCGLFTVYVGNLHSNVMRFFCVRVFVS